MVKDKLLHLTLLPLREIYNAYWSFFIWEVTYNLFEHAPPTHLPYYLKNSVLSKEKVWSRDWIRFRLSGKLLFSSTIHTLDFVAKPCHSLQITTLVLRKAFALFLGFSRH
jgi:hypothetical protein